MQDSDDLFDDDLVLDENTIAILDNAELKHSLTPSTGSSTRPVKRQKTGHSPWSGFARGTVDDDFEDMPEISVRNDGSYGIRGSQGLDVLVQANSTVNHSATSSTAAPELPKRVPSRSENALRPPPTRRASTPTARLQRSRSIREAIEAPQRTPSAHTTNRFEGTFRASQSQRRESHAPRASQASSTSSEHRLRRELEILRVQVEELQVKAAQAEKTAKEAENARFAREGEVSILRKGIEKTAREHAASLSKLKSAKEAAEAAQTQLQKEMKEEMERLRTEFMFKQHEIETSFRKVPGSIRSSKVNRDMFATPMQAITPRVPHSSVRRQLAVDISPLVRRKAIPRPQFGEGDPGTSKLRSVRQGTPKKAAPLPGFYNSFLPGPGPTQRKSPKQEVPIPALQSNGKGKARQNPTPSLFSYRSQILDHNEPIPSPPSSPTARAQDAPGDDIVMGDVELDEGDIPPPAFGSQNANDNAAMDDEEGPEPPDLPNELRRILFSHALPSHTLTLQMLLGAPLPSTLTESDTAHYVSTCSDLMRLLGTAVTLSWETLVQNVADKLVQLIRHLDSSDLAGHLTALFDLLVSLCFAFPSFCRALLLPPDFADDVDQCPVVVTSLCHVIRNHLVPARVTIREAYRGLVEETLSFMEALCFGVDRTSERYLAQMLTSPGVATVLFDAAHPPWLLNRTTRLLVLIASRGGASTYLLSYIPVKEGQETIRAQMEHLSAFLVHHSCIDVEMEAARVNILTFFAMLCAMDRDAAAILLESPTLLPSLVVFITRMTVPLWEEERDPSDIVDPRETIRAVHQTLFLLHALVCNHGEQPYDLRQKLHHAPYRQFNGLIHMFIVTFGRLSYADAPEWLPGELRDEVEDMTEMARDLLDLVVEGPELDKIFVAYQDEDSEVDDEELEARNLEANLLE
ncbi:hypothetical protein OE88DRAFT_1654294 [Heliocybe sulcata]|uniref:Uncharacterized protein n=1 Tax=Heliocybe sulcata TaxID=5364 RepID=A0A5C3N855_9AGAM|nr:hypothetical protein OE88DRAFT_1654294 [Heliocybe sulcata]